MPDRRGSMYDAARNAFVSPDTPSDHEGGLSAVQEKSAPAVATAVDDSAGTTKQVFRI